ncbi:sensor histidine kinase [Angelakisella massiliensis]|uniref:sensor histidine kinase n=1 Tax=Angelakisella massiliensis TaxID=1871018 RepID=UPI0023A87BCD|nr:HAMP domain-containing sensor histidine kinase [Angelakisella massiliensis]
MFKRLRRKLTFYCTAVTSVILAGMALASLSLSEQALNQRGSAAFAGDVNAILYHIISQKVLDHTWLAQTETSGQLMILVEDSGQSLLFSGSWDRPHRQELLEAARQTALEDYYFDLSQPPQTHFQSERVTFSFTSPSGIPCYGAAAVVPLERGWAGLLVVKPMTGELMQINNLRWMFAGLLAVAVCLLGIFSWFFTRRAIEPVEESRRKQVEFVSAAGHELRSPLAVIQSSVSAMETAPPDKAVRFRQTISQECSRMSRLVGDLLLLASADNSSWSVHFQEVEPETLLLETAESFETVAAAKGARLDVHLPEDLLPKCQWDGQRISQVLTILVDNALSYGGEGCHILLEARQNRGRVELMVADNGPGIPPAQRKRIFERFYRTDPARSKKDHYGLGLSIAREIISLHRGSIRVEETPGGGATFILSLPVRQRY